MLQQGLKPHARSPEDRRPPEDIWVFSDQLVLLSRHAFRLNLTFLSLLLILKSQPIYPWATVEMDYSSTSMATSASSLFTMSGGAMRMVLGPQPRKRTPCSNAD